MQFKTAADRDYANAAFIPGGEEFPALWQAEAQDFVAAMGERARTGLAYGEGERQRFDLFLPRGKAQGLVVLIHGGYWMRFGRESFSHLAGGAVARGWAVAMPSYTLAPVARIRDITAEIARAVEAASARVPGPVVVTGHSAGGHLAARMACEDGPAQVVRALSVSPLSDLEPLMATEMNKTLRLDAAECAAESPARLRRRAGVGVHVWVGAQERPA
jgi:acetyl esterase/lipase